MKVFQTRLSLLAALSVSMLGADCSGTDSTASTVSSGGNVTQGGMTGSTNSQSFTGGSPTLGSTSATAGTQSTAGAFSSGGAQNIGGSIAAGATPSNGGQSSVGGTLSAGGTTNAGGTSSSGGSLANVGSSNVGGAVNTGGTKNSGGFDGSGGASVVGGTSNAGGTTTTGGISNAGGNTASSWQLDSTECLSTTKPSFSQQTHSLKPTSLWASNLTSPRPTNAFWMNLVLNTGNQRINLLPYQIKALSSGLSVSRPPLTAVDASVTTADRTDVQLSTSESLSKHEVTAYDDLSVTVTFTATNGTLVTPLVHGMPYATGLYQGLTPSIKIPSAAITQVNGVNASSVTGQKLVLTLNNGQTWNVYASSSMSWNWTSGEIHADQALTGSLRVALVPNNSASQVLDDYAGAIPTSGAVHLSQTGNVAQVRFDWQRQGQGVLLMMALPHHVPRLVATTTQALSHATLRGNMTSITGDSWALNYPLSSITWTAPRAPDAGQVANIKAALQQDSAYVPTAQDSYFGGKHLAKLARLSLIAQELGETTLASTFVGNLRTRVNSWLDATNEQKLVYDTTWGGVVTAAGIQDSGADFGQGHYNDHHFHYGYHAYAAAAVARDDSSWVSSYADKALRLARDIANPCRSDPYFPRFRSFDWFVGHSWAAGLFEFGDSRNQESTSEAVNAWYGVQLLGQALGNATLERVGAILRAVETVSAQTYWQVTDASTIYPAPFKNHHVVGVLWSTKVDFGTFFGTNPEYIYGIQMLPFTPATEDLLNPTWVADAWPQLSAAASSTTEQGWKGFMVMAHGVISKSTALTEVQNLTSYDDGNSKANALYWAATRP